MDGIKKVAEYAVDMTGISFAETFAMMDDDYFKARCADVLDISKRVVNILAGIKEAGIDSDEPVIVVADDLTPSETVQMDKSKILAFVTRFGSKNSHTAILARSMNLPSLIKCDIELLDEYDGQMAVVDSFNNTLIVDPDEETLDKSKITHSDLFDSRYWYGEGYSQKTYIDDITYNVILTTKKVIKCFNIQ